MADRQHTSARNMPNHESINQGLHVAWRHIVLRWVWRRHLATGNRPPPPLRRHSGSIKTLASTTPGQPQAKEFAKRPPAQRWCPELCESPAIGATIMPKSDLISKSDRARQSRPKNFQTGTPATTGAENTKYRTTLLSRVSFRASHACETVRLPQGTREARVSSNWKIHRRSSVASATPT